MPNSTVQYLYLLPDDTSNDHLGSLTKAAQFIFKYINFPIFVSMSALDFLPNQQESELHSIFLVPSNIPNYRILTTRLEVTV